jgi:hypothetical protein
MCTSDGKYGLPVDTAVLVIVNMTKRFDDGRGMKLIDYLDIWRRNSISEDVVVESMDQCVSQPVSFDPYELAAFILFEFRSDYF